MKTYSMTQRWAPVLVGERSRPHLLALMDEQQGDCLGTELVSKPLRPAALGRWVADKIDKTLEGELWVDHPSLVGPMSMYFPKLKVSLQAKPRHLTDFLASFAAKFQMKDVKDYCLSEQYGEAAAQKFYAQAWAFYANRPWERIPKEESLAFRDSQGNHWRLMVLGSAGEEFGVHLGDPPHCGVLLRQPGLLAAADLDLVDRAGLVYAGDEYPWILNKDLPLTRAWVEDLGWLLEALPQLSGGSLENQGRRLQRASQPNQELMEVLLTYWGKHSQVAQALAAFLLQFFQNWMAAKRRGQRNCERTFQELHWIGEDYLAAVKKKKFWLDYFLGEPPVPDKTLSEKDRHAYLKTWKLLASYAEIVKYEHTEASLP